MICNTCLTYTVAQNNQRHCLPLSWHSDLFWCWKNWIVVFCQLASFLLEVDKNRAIYQRWSMSEPVVHVFYRGAQLDATGWCYFGPPCRTANEWVLYVVDHSSNIIPFTCQSHSCILIVIIYTYIYSMYCYVVFALRDAMFSLTYVMLSLLASHSNSPTHGSAWRMSCCRYSCHTVTVLHTAQLDLCHAVVTHFTQ